MFPVLRVGIEQASHPGPPPKIAITVEGSPKTKANGAPIVRNGDRAICEEHGETIVIATTIKVFDGGKSVARIGDATACGAVFGVTGTPSNVLIG